MIRGYAIRCMGAAVGALLLFANGCGYKNAPIPPESVVPKPIADLMYKTDENGVKLSWFYPVETIKGEELDDISSFELYRAEVDLEDYCSTCPIPFGEPIKLGGGIPMDGEERRKATHEDSLLRAGYKYFFKIRSRTSWWADSADSNIVSFVWFTPAMGPEGVTVTAQDRQVALAWQPVTTLIDGSETEMAMKYQILRRTDKSGYQLLGEPVAATEYLDHKVANGVQYFYTIQSMMVLQDELVSGERSKELAVTPVDLTPPSAPRGVTVVRTGVGNKIFWERNREDDLGGYKVYRRAGKNKKFKLQGTVDSAYTIFVDAKADEGVRYSYTVTAIDKAIPPNESSKSKEATPRY